MYFNMMQVCSQRGQYYFTLFETKMVLLQKCIYQPRGRQRTDHRVDYMKQVSPLVYELSSSCTTYQSIDYMHTTEIIRDSAYATLILHLAVGRQLEDKSIIIQKVSILTKAQYVIYRYNQLSVLPNSVVILALVNMNLIQNFAGAHMY